jgi:hypothetical protein
MQENKIVEEKFTFPNLSFKKTEFDSQFVNIRSGFIPSVQRVNFFKSKLELPLTDDARRACKLSTEFENISIDDFFIDRFA